jgi:biotin operon repressor
MRTLTPALKHEIAALSFLYESYIPGPLALPVGSFLTFEDELARVRAFPDDQMLRFELTRPLYGGAIARDPAGLDDSSVRKVILTRARDHSREREDLVALALDAPRELLSRLCTLMEEYWRSAFRREWETIEEKLAASVVEAGHLLAAGGIYNFLNQLGPFIHVDHSRGEFWRQSEHEHVVEIGPGERLLLVPSVYVWPHIRIGCDAPWPLSLVFPAPFARRLARPPLPPEELVSVLRAVGERTRLTALRMLAERERTGQELAPLLGVTQSALSRHLRKLHEAGLLTARRDGYYVLYGRDTSRP